MRNKSERGFSLIELLIVVVVIGIIAAFAVPYLQKAVRAAENANTFATMRSISAQQVDFYGRNSRFARIVEVNNLVSGSLGTNSGNDVNRGKFVLSMVPASPTDVELKSGFTITATRNVASEGQMYVYQLDQTGVLVQVIP